VDSAHQVDSLPEDSLPEDSLVEDSLVDFRRLRRQRDSQELVVGSRQEDSLQSPVPPQWPVLLQ
jgi:hypothetical protein